jgi:hypothetical protein
VTPTISQRKAILTEAIALLEQHPPSLESYTNRYFGAYLRSCRARKVEPNVEEFFAIVPAVSRTPRYEADNNLQHVLDRFEDELLEIEKLEKDMGNGPKAPKKASPKGSGSKKD